MPLLVPLLARRSHALVAARRPWVENCEHFTCVPSPSSRPFREILAYCTFGPPLAFPIASNMERDQSGATRQHLVSLAGQSRLSALLDRSPVALQISLSDSRTNRVVSQRGV